MGYVTSLYNPKVQSSNHRHQQIKNDHKVKPGGGKLVNYNLKKVLTVTSIDCEKVGR